MNNKWTIIYCSDYRGNFLHEDHIKRSNPEAQILKLDFTNNYPPHIIWKQCDLVIRPWLKENKSKIKHNNVAIVEYDVLITQELPDIFLDNEIIGTKILYPEKDTWWKFFDDSYKLGYLLKRQCCGLIFFCFYLMSRNCIDYWTDSKHDYLYKENKDISCELRVPTILKFNKVNIKESYSDIMRNINVVHIEKFDKNIPGFYHPIKKDLKDYCYVK